MVRLILAVWISIIGFAEMVFAEEAEATKPAVYMEARLGVKINLPEYWQEQKQETLNEFMEELDINKFGVKYESLFLLVADPNSNEPWSAVDNGQIYALVELKPMKLDLINFDSFEEGVRKAFKKEMEKFKAESKGLGFEFEIKSQSLQINRQLQRINQQTVIDYGDSTVQVTTCRQLTKNGVFILHCYCPVEDRERSQPVIQALMNNVQVLPGYKIPEGSNNELPAGSKFVMFVIVAVILGGFKWLFKK